ncbi:MAG: hypothetical protein II458_08220 [Oscillospiraceae bacterium]|nr:hypothetical protein [Oscillospiraceae bacterium]
MNYQEMTFEEMKKLTREELIQAIKEVAAQLTPQDLRECIRKVMSHE